MARQLGVEVGSEIILVAPAADGSLGNDLFTLVGIIRTGLTAMDATHGYLPVADLQHLLALEPTRIHEVALRVTGPWDAPAAAEALTASLGDRFGPLAVEPWTEFRAELREYAILAESFNGVIVVIVFGMAVFGVANTMLMATYERRREFAVVRALGTPSRNVALTVVLEGLTLGIVSLAVGALVAFPLMVWWHNSPPDLGSIFGDFTMAGSLVRPILRVDYSTDGPVLSAIALLLTGVLAAAYPALRAVRIPPADALSGR
jgi:ABC-type lipoprotein release transport system permease subunit